MCFIVPYRSSTFSMVHFFIEHQDKRPREKKFNWLASGCFLGGLRCAPGWTSRPWWFRDFASRSSRTRWCRYSYQKRRFGFRKRSLFSRQIAILAEKRGCDNKPNVNTPNNKKANENTANFPKQKELQANKVCQQELTVTGVDNAGDFLLWYSNPKMKILTSSRSSWWPEFVLWSVAILVPVSMTRSLAVNPIRSFLCYNINRKPEPFQSLRELSSSLCQCCRKVQRNKWRDLLRSLNPTI